MLYEGTNKNFKNSSGCNGEGVKETGSFRNIRGVHGIPGTYWVTLTGELNR